MSEVHDRLKVYVYKITKGLVSLKEEHTEEIERLVKLPRAYAKLSKWNAQSRTYDPSFTETTTDTDIEYIRLKYKDITPLLYFAKWDLYNSNGEHVCTVYTTSHVLNYLLL